MLEACAAALTLSMIIPLVPFLWRTEAVAAAGIPLVVSKDMMQPPPISAVPPQRVLTDTNSHCLPEPVLSSCVIGEHCPAARPKRNVAASGAEFITPAALKPILYRVGSSVALFALPQT